MSEPAAHVCHIHTERGCPHPEGGLAGVLLWTEREGSRDYAVAWEADSEENMRAAVEWVMDGLWLPGVASLQEIFAMLSRVMRIRVDATGERVDTPLLQASAQVALLQAHEAHTAGGADTGSTP